MSDNGFTIRWPRKSINTQKIIEANSKLPPAVLNAQVEKAKEILSCCVPYDAGIGSKKVGLVVGKVQSGKTTSFSLLTSLAADNGYKIIIHLLGTTTNLKASNAQDVKKVLCSDDDDNYWNSFDVTTLNVKESTDGLEQILYEANNSGLDFLGDREDNVMYFYLLKNHSVINKFAKEIEDFHSNLRRSNEPLPIMIIDDEVDSYSPDVSKEDDEKTSTHKSLERLYDACPIVSYVGYTATSQAIAYSEVDSFLNPDFVATINAGEGYDGNLELFGNKLDRIFNPQPCDTPNTKEIKIRINADGDESEDDRSESLFEAVRYYLVSSCLFVHRKLLKNQGGSKECASMMIHGGLELDTHNSDDKLVKDYLDQLKNFFREEEDANNSDISKSLFLSIYNELFSEDIDSVSFDDLLKNIKAIIDENQIRLVVVNADKRKGRSSIPDVKWSKSKFWIVTGGHGLSRGYVVEGLITTWMPRQAARLTADTIEQLGRFFGYHNKFSDLIRIFLKRDSIEAFKAYHIYETSVWDMLDRCISDGTRLAEMQPLLELPQELDDQTSSAKRKRKDAKKTFTWAISQYTPFMPNQTDVTKNANFDQVLSAYIASIKSQSLLIDCPKIEYQEWYQDQDLAKENCSEIFKIAKDIPMENIYNNLFEDIIKIISPLDVNLQSQISFIKNNALNEFCDVIIIKHPGRGKEKLSTRRIYSDFDQNYHIRYVHQGKNVISTFKGDEEVLLSDSNFTVHIHLYETVNRLDNQQKIQLLDIKDIKTISISRPMKEKVKTQQLL